MAVPIVTPVVVSVKVTERPEKGSDIVAVNVVDAPAMTEGATKEFTISAPVSGVLIQIVAEFLVVQVPVKTRSSDLDAGPYPSAGLPLYVARNVCVPENAGKYSTLATPEELVMTDGNAKPAVSS